MTILAAVLIAILEAAILCGWWRFLSWWENRRFWKKRRPFPSGTPEDECFAAMIALERKIFDLRRAKEQEDTTVVRTTDGKESGKCRHFLCIEIPERDAQKFLDELTHCGKFIDLGTVAIMSAEENETAGDN